MTSDEKIDGLDAIIEDLVEWELAAMDYASLQEYYFDAKKEYYYSNPEGLEDMLEYKKDCLEGTIVMQPKDTVFFWDIGKQTVQEDERTLGEVVLDSIVPRKNEPEPHPYTHPIRDIPDYSKVKK